MGIYKEKYTKEYFTGEDSYGNKLNYGAEKKYDSEGNLILRDQDLSIVSQLNFKDRNVLEFGVGRGECAKYILEHEPNKYVGVDFSCAALEIAAFVTKDCKFRPEFYEYDALEYVKSICKKATDKIDIVVMLDFVEHIPRAELKEMLTLLNSILSDKSIVVINTPAYMYDNDVISEGIDTRNHKDAIDTADFIEETAGMHCNKYNVVSLQDFMEECGYKNITEYHFFIKNNTKSDILHSFKYMWKYCYENEYPIEENYIPDVIEYANKTVQIKKQKFTVGTMSNINLYTTDEYRKIAYKDGEYDSEMMDDFKKNYSDVSTIIDVGGFVGLSSLMFAKYNKNANIYIFEPNPWNVNRIRMNLSINESISKKIKLVRLAMGECTSICKMHLSNNIDNGYSSTSRLEGVHAKINNEYLPEGFEDYNVQVETFDNFISKNGIKPDLIKVDIEGAEVLFLRGAIQVLSQYKPVIYMEIHSEYCAIECFRLLNSIGYDVNVIFEETDNRVMIKAISVRDVEDIQNILYKNITVKMEEYNRKLSNIGNSVDEIICQYKVKEESARKEYNELSDKYNSAKNELKLKQEFCSNLENENEELKKELNLIKNTKWWRLYEKIRS